MEQPFLEEHEQFSQQATLFASTLSCLASAITFFTSSQLSLLLSVTNQGKPSFVLTLIFTGAGNSRSLNKV
jgi:hypothetical protein